MKEIKQLKKNGPLRVNTLSTNLCHMHSLLSLCFCQRGNLEWYNWSLIKV
jgi:hypothetical protein